MDIDWTETERRAAIHASLAEPARLAVIDQLVMGDRSPGELAGSLHLPSNLLAHHVNVLERAGLLCRSRSEGDRRRTYLQLVPSALAQLVPSAALTARRVVFVCTRNSARSQLAAALWAKRSQVPVASAGTDPAARVDRRAIAVAHRHGLSIADARTASLPEMLEPSDLTVAVCDGAHERLGPTEGRLHWSVADPVRAGTAEAFERAFGDLDARVRRLASLVECVNPGDRPSHRSQRRRST